MNCGGNDYTAVDGTKWVGDYYFSGGDLLYSSDAINNTQDLALYRSGRAGLYGDFGYSIPVQNGSYCRPSQQAGQAVFGSSRRDGREGA